MCDRPVGGQDGSWLELLDRFQGLVELALIDERDEPVWVRENRELKEELTALEQLLEDLREIDAE